MMDHDHGDEDPNAYDELRMFPVTRPENSGQHAHPRAYGVPFGTFHNHTAWWQTRTYRDPALRYAAIQRDRLDTFLAFRRFKLRNEHPMIVLGASLAIAGAAAVSRTTFLNLDSALELMVAMQCRAQ